MAEESRTPVAFLVPVQDNDGASLEHEIRELEQELFAEFGGFSQEGRVRGAWQMASGERVDDVSIRYVVAVEGPEGLQRLLSVLDAFKSRTRQEALYVEIRRNVEVRII